MHYTIQDLAHISIGKIHQLDSLAHNLANAGTPGYKAANLHLRSSSPSRFVEILQSVDYSQGTLERTGNALDAAIQGEGFFTVQTNEGLAYTRKGSFLLNGNKELTTEAGWPVLGDGGRISVRGADVRIEGNGSVVVDGSAVGRLKISRFGQPAELKKRGDSLFVDGGNAQPKRSEQPRIAQGSIERSNTRVVEQMVAMIEVQRMFETYTKIVQSLSEIDRLSTNRVGKLG